MKYLTLNVTVIGHPAAPMVLLFPEAVDHAKVFEAAQASVQANLPGDPVLTVRGAGFAYIGESQQVHTHGMSLSLDKRPDPGDALLIAQFLLHAAR